MKNSRILVVSMSVLLLFVTINQVVYGASETIPLSPGTSIVRNVELQKDERLVGSFTINNLQTWKNGWGDTVSYIVSVTVTDPKGQMVLSYTKNNGDSFNYTAFYSGVYTFRFICGIEYFPPYGIENPQVTLNYNIVTPSQPQSGTSIFDNLSTLQMIPIFAGIIISVIILVTYFVLNIKKSA